MQVRGTEPRLTNVTINGITRALAGADRAAGAPRRARRPISSNRSKSTRRCRPTSGRRRHRRLGQPADEDRQRHADVMLNALGGYNPILGGRGNNQFGLTSAAASARRSSSASSSAAPTTGTAAASTTSSRRSIRRRRRSRRRSTTTTRSANTATTARAQGLTGSGDYKRERLRRLCVQRHLFQPEGLRRQVVLLAGRRAATPKFYTSSKRPEYTIGSLNGGGKHSDARRRGSPGTSPWRTPASSHSAGNPKADFSWIGPKLTCGFRSVGADRRLRAALRQRLRRRRTRRCRTRRTGASRT